MRVVIFGASGMVGQGALQECLRDPDVRRVVSVVRAATGKQHEKLHEIVHQNFLDFAAIEHELTGLDACLFCLGVSSAGISEDAYTRITYGFTIAAAQTLLKLNPGMSFVHVSGSGADSSERGRVMWARVKGKTENALLAMPFRSAYMFRPGIIQPLNGIKSKTPSYRWIYKAATLILAVARRFWPQFVSTTEELGRALLAAAKRGTGKRVVEAKEISVLLQTLS
jgi:uncharacterized protein YbjT (DUF2867 family)